MIEILENKDSNFIKQQCDEKKVCYSENTKLIAVTDKTETIGICIFDSLDDEILINYADTIIPPLFDGMIRSVLNWGFLNNKKSATFCKNIDIELLKKLRIVNNLDNLTINTCEIFTSCDHQ